MEAATPQVNLPETEYGKPQGGDAPLAIEGLLSASNLGPLSSTTTTMYLMQWEGSVGG